MPLPINLWLIHPKRKMCEEWKLRFAGLANVTILQSRYEDLRPHDCFVTAANSFGIMNAGIDAAVIAFHGEDLMKRIQFRIMNEYLGEQPIGTSLIEPTDNSDYPFIAHTPTMRVPGSIKGTDKVYCATWAALIAVYKHNTSSEVLNHSKQRIETLAFPALGAGFGGVSYREVARQMAVAYKHYLSPPHRLNWDIVAARRRELCFDGDERVILD